MLKIDILPLSGQQISISRRPSSGKTRARRTLNRGLLLWAIWMIACMCWFSRRPNTGFVSSVFAKPTAEKEQSMVSRLPVIDDAGEVGDLSHVDAAALKPFSSLPESLQSKLRAGRPKAEVTKERITIRLSPDVVGAFRATGDGWQTRIDAALREWLRTHKPA